MSEESQVSDVTGKTLLTEHLAAYFKAFDSDYADLKKLLNMEPLKITVLKTGTMKAYCRDTGRTLDKLNIHATDLSALKRYEK